MLAETISIKIASVQCFCLLKLGVEVQVTAPVVQCALECVLQSHVVAGTPPRVFLPVVFGMMLTGKLSSPQGIRSARVAAVST